MNSGAAARAPQEECVIGQDGCAAGISRGSFVAAIVFLDKT